MGNFANLSLFSSLAGTAAQTVAGVKAAGAQKDIYDAEAASARTAGEYNANLAREQGKRVLGKGRAIAGASGLVTTSGSPLDIMLESAKQAEMEALGIQYEAEQRARGLKMRGQYAARAGSQAVASGVLKGSTYFSDWFNKYAPLSKKNGTSPAGEIGAIPQPDQLALAEDIPYPRRPGRLRA